MTLTRHTQVENLVNTLSARRRHDRTEAARDQAYLALIATVLERPVEELEMRLSGAPAPLRRHSSDHPRAA
jgi:hypothetical protein